MFVCAINLRHLVNSKRFDPADIYTDLALLLLAVLQWPRLWNGSVSKHATPLLRMKPLSKIGATTYRLCTNGLVIFLDTWLDRPDVLPKYPDIDEITVADYIFISHAHFDQ